MSQKKQFQTRLDPDIAERVEDYADENDVSHSEAVRRIVRAGLEAADGPTRDEIAADLEEIRSEIRGVRGEIEDDDHDDDPDTTVAFAQMNAVKLGLLISALSLAFYLGTLTPM